MRRTTRSIIAAKKIRYGRESECGKKGGFHVPKGDRRKVCLSRETFVAGLLNLSAKSKGGSCCSCCFVTGAIIGSREDCRRFGVKRMGSAEICCAGCGAGGSCGVYAGA